jgi:hypothetical protein
VKAKTVKAILRKKIDEWLASIDDEGLRSAAHTDAIVTGGAIASMLLNEKVNDFDVYFKTRDTARRIADYYVAHFKPETAKRIPCKISVQDDPDGRIRIVVKSAGIASEGGTEKPYEYFEAQPSDEAAGYVASVMTDPGDIQDTYEETEAKAQDTEDDGKPKYRPVFLSTNAITLSHRLQIVIRFFGEPDAIHENYDFVHCTNYWTSGTDELVLRQPALEALLARELRYVGSKYPLCSVVRLRKFIARGWTINAGQILKMCMQLSALDLTDIAVLQDQLTGVDAAYFLQVIEKLKEKDPEKVNSAYLIEIIDRMF